MIHTGWYRTRAMAATNPNRWRRSLRRAGAGIECRIGWNNQEMIMLGKFAGMILAAGVALAGAVLAAAPVSAQTYDPRYPVCMTLTEWGGARIDCSFQSIPQCKEAGSGRAAQCDVNPYYGYDRRSPR
jgi:hypothetical protein